ncbi:hypothetical protein MRY87_00180 [bacterium]|nr:hypothetical protein [bacterium]
MRTFVASRGIWMGSLTELAVPRQFDGADAAVEIASSVAAEHGHELAKCLRVPAGASEMGTDWEYLAMVRGSDENVYRVCIGLGGQPEALELVQEDGSRKLFSLDLQEVLGEYSPELP